MEFNSYSAGEVKNKLTVYYLAPCSIMGKIILLKGYIWQFFSKHALYLKTFIVKYIVQNWKEIVNS